MNLPTPEQLAKIIAQSSFSLEEKQKILASLPYLSNTKIIKLYTHLLELQAEEITLQQKSLRLNLKYQIKIEQAIAEAKK